MPGIMRQPSGERRELVSAGPIADERIHLSRDALTTLLREAERARAGRAEAASGSGSGDAVCAWNHFENIPTFYNWNNRPR